MKNYQSDVWKLETPTQESACDEMNFLYELATKGKVSARNLIKKCYGDNWKTIRNRMETEGSVWYVWYMDGVNNFVANYLREEK